MLSAITKNLWLHFVKAISPPESALSHFTAIDPLYSIPNDTDITYLGLDSMLEDPGVFEGIPTRKPAVRLQYRRNFSYHLVLLEI
jgi:hypothetical protein